MKINKKIIYVIFIAFILIPFIRVIIGSFKKTKDYKAFKNELRVIDHADGTVTDDYGGITINKYTEDSPYLYNMFGENLNTIRINLYMNEGLNLVDFINVLKYRDAEQVIYHAENIPKDFANVLNQFNNIKLVNLFNTESITKKNVEGIKELNTEVLFGKINDKESFSAIKSMKKLKRLEVRTDFKKEDLSELSIENNTLEGVLFRYGKSVTGEYDFFNSQIMKNYKEILKFNTPNLKNIDIDCEYKTRLSYYGFGDQGLNMEVIFENDDVNLDSLSIRDFETVIFPERENKIKVKELTIEELNFDKLSITEDFKGIDLDSVQSLDVVNRIYVKKVNYNFINEFKNLEQLYVGDDNLIDISWLEQSQNLKKLIINIDYVNDFSVLKSLPNLKEVKFYGYNKIDENLLKDLNKLNILVSTQIY